MRLHINKKSTKKKNLLKDNEDRIIGLVNDYLYPIKKIDRYDLSKTNIIRIAKHHKDTCIGVECDISLYELLQVAISAGLEFTDEEVSLFM